MLNSQDTNFSADFSSTPAYQKKEIPVDDKINWKWLAIKKTASSQMYGF